MIAQRCARDEATFIHPQLAAIQHDHRSEGWLGGVTPALLVWGVPLAGVYAESPSSMSASWSGAITIASCPHLISLVFQPAALIQVRLASRGL